MILRAAVPGDASRIADILIASRAAFLPYAPSPHSDDEVRAWVRDVLIRTEEITVPTPGGQVFGVLSVRRAEAINRITQLYLDPAYVGRGIGSMPLSHSLATVPRPIRLLTFQQNTGARRFYQRHGFVAVLFSNGQSNEEHCPDVLYELARRQFLLHSVQVWEIMRLEEAFATIL